MSTKVPYWVSFVMHERISFELHTPWWRSGYTPDGEPIICAAVLAYDEDDAKRAVVAAHDSHVILDWRFVEERPLGWSPFCDRFRRADWMKWPSSEAPEPFAALSRKDPS